MSNYCDIIIPVWNERGMTKRCFDRIRRNTEYPYRLIIIDNGSGNETKTFLEEEKDGSVVPFDLIRNNDNVGFVRAVNQGFKESAAPFICILNNDTLVCKGWLRGMVNLFLSDGNVGIVNPSSNMLGLDSKEEQIDALAESLKGNNGRYVGMDTARGFCMLIKREVLVRTGYFDESFGMGYFEEADFCKRARKFGYGSFMARSSYVYHVNRASFKRVRDADSLFERNKIKYFRRWGRPVWVAFIALGQDGINDPIGIVEQALDAGHRVLVVAAKGEHRANYIPHINLKVKELSPPFFLRALLMLAFRKRSKKARCIIYGGHIPRLLNVLSFMLGGRQFSGSQKDLAMEYIRVLSFNESYIKEKG